MSQKYGSDPTRNLLVDKVESTEAEYKNAVYNLKTYDMYKTDYEGGDSNDTIRKAKRL